MLKFKKEYAFAHSGVRVERFVPGQTVETPTPELYQSAIQDGAAVDPDAAQPEPEPRPEHRKSVKTKA